ncbi:unnamed protein product, partial [Prorocentrum cordatum]
RVRFDSWMYGRRSPARTRSSKKFGKDPQPSGQPQELAPSCQPQQKTSGGLQSMLSDHQCEAVHSGSAARGSPRGQAQQATPRPNLGCSHVAARQAEDPAVAISPLAGAKRLGSSRRPSPAGGAQRPGEMPPAAGRSGLHWQQQGAAAAVAAQSQFRQRLPDAGSSPAGSGVLAGAGRLQRGKERQHRPSQHDHSSAIEVLDSQAPPPRPPPDAQTPLDVSDSPLAPTALDVLDSQSQDVTVEDVLLPRSAAGAAESPSPPAQRTLASRHFQGRLQAKRGKGASQREPAAAPAEQGEQPSDGALDEDGDLAMFQTKRIRVSMAGLTAAPETSAAATAEEKMFRRLTRTSRGKARVRAATHDGILQDRLADAAVGHPAAGGAALEALGSDPFRAPRSSDGPAQAAAPSRPRRGARRSGARAAEPARGARRVRSRETEKGPSLTA